MTALEFASLLHAKQIRRGQWLALCPAHADRKPSLSISVGRKQPVVFVCRSQGCTQAEILAAMGLTWRDLMGERPQMSREAKARFSDETYLRDLKELRRSLIVDAYRAYPEAFQGARSVEGLHELNRRIISLENRLNPALQAIRERDEKTARFVKRWGWDKLWELYLQSEGEGDATRQP